MSVWQRIGSANSNSATLSELLALGPQGLNVNRQVVTVQSQ